MTGPSVATSSIFWQRRWAHAQLLAACLWNNTGPIWHHQQYFYERNSWPIHNHQWNFSAAPMCLFTTFGSMSLEEYWAHIWPSAAFLWRDGWPIQNHGRIFWQHQWAYSQLLAACLWNNTGPIRHHWQYFYKWKSWPICNHQQNSLAAPMGQFTTSGSMSVEEYWAHPGPLAEPFSSTSHIMDSHGLCHWYSQPTPESYVIDTPANVGRRLDSYIFDTSTDTSWAEDLRCIQRAIRCPVIWHSDHPVCMGVYCWTRKLCPVAFQWYNMHPFTFCKSSDMLHLIYSVPMLLDQPVGQFAEI